MIELLLIFIIYTFLGWALEVIFHASIHGKFTNRGFLHGPFCPIYGVSLVLIHLFLYDKNINPFLIIVSSSAIISSLELVGGFLMDKIFKQRWWDYSNIPFNIGGYVCLSFSIIWGIGCLLVVDYIHPLVMGIVNVIDDKSAIILIIIILTIISVDFIYVVLDLLKFNKHLKNIANIIDKMDSVSHKIGNVLANGTIKTNKKIEPIKKELMRLTKAKEIQIKEIMTKERRLLISFPNYKHVKYNHILKEIKLKMKKTK